MVRYSATSSGVPFGDICLTQLNPEESRPSGNISAKQKRELLQAPHTKMWPDSEWDNPRERTIEKEN
jgi:hypothetical protein